MPPRPEPLQPCRMIELTTNPPRIDRNGGSRFNDTRIGYEPPDHDRISSEVVVWTPAVPTAVERSEVERPESDTRVSVECIELGSRLDPRLTLLSNPDSPQAKAFRLLRHKLGKHADPRLIAVTSAERGEGKTTCAVNLALAIAEETLTRVLLFEANVRQPALARMFGFEPRECLSSQMARLHGPTRGYRIAAVAGTRLCIAAMSPDLAPGTRLDRFLVSVALSELRSEYDYIVVDFAGARKRRRHQRHGMRRGRDPGRARQQVAQKNVRAAIEQIGRAPLLGIRSSTPARPHEKGLGGRHLERGWVATCDTRAPGAHAEALAAAAHLFAVCDHYEPAGERPAPRGEGTGRNLGTGLSGPGERLSRRRGCSPKHTFFFPGEQYTPSALEHLAGLARPASARVDSPASRSRTPKSSRLRFATISPLTRNRALSRGTDGKPRYAFITETGAWPTRAATVAGAVWMRSCLCCSRPAATRTSPFRPRPTKPSRTSSIRSTGLLTISRVRALTSAEGRAKSAGSTAIGS